MSTNLSSLDEFRKTIDSLQNEVVCFLSESTSDLKLIDESLRGLGLHHDVFSPFPPYNHNYDIVTDFARKVERDKRGAYRVLLSTQRALFFTPP